MKYKIKTINTNRVYIYAMQQFVYDKPCAWSVTEFDQMFK